ncbi:MAG TPA: hypothetical protein VLR89_04795 [Anaerolineaceae bacterium]|nr:hypothetical protein [Anaerolineaceae bacterium]
MTDTTKTLVAFNQSHAVLGTPEFLQYLPWILNQPSTPTKTTYPNPIYPPTITPIGPMGVTVTSVLIDPVHQNIVYAGAFEYTNNYGWSVLKSIDYGTTWFKSGNGILNGTAIQSLSLIPSSPNVVFAGSINHGLFRSVNYGDTWTQVGPEFGTNAVYGITPDPNRPNVVYIVTRITDTAVCQGYRGAFYRSEDWGVTWTLLRYGDIEGTCADYWYDVDVNPWDSNIVYLPYHQHGPYRSIDYASSFNPLRNGITDLQTRSMAIDILSKRMYSGFWDPNYVYYSDNMGEQWLKTNFNGSGVLKVSLGPLDTSRQRVFLSTYSNGVAYSNNSGASWATSTFQNPQNIVYDVAASNTNPQRWYVGTQFTGLYISTNSAASWSPAGTGVIASSIAGLTDSPQLPGETIAAVYGQGILTTSDSGVNWEKLNEGLDSTNVTSVYDFDGELFASADTGVYKFDGLIWQNLSMPAVAKPNLEAYLDYSSDTFPIDKQLAGEMLASNQKSLPSLQKSGILPGNTPVTRLALGNGQLYAGTAGDGLWIRDANLWQQAGFEGQSIADVAFSQDGSQGLVAACTLTNFCSVYAKSEASWVEMAQGLNNQVMQDLLIAPDGKRYAATSGGIYRMQMTTGNWQNLLETEAPIKSISSNEDGKWLIATGEGAAWYSLDRGEHWQVIDGLDQKLTYTSALFANDGSLILGSDAGGAYKLELPKP